MNTNNRNDKKGKTGIKRFYNALFYSCEGIQAAFKDEEGFRQVLIIATITFCIGLWVGDGFSQKILLVLPGFLCIVVELLNSAIENAIDHTSLELHPLAKKAKDMGSAAQMFSLIFLILVWGIFLCLKIF